MEIQSQIPFREFFTFCIVLRGIIGISSIAVRLRLQALKPGGLTYCSPGLKSLGANTQIPQSCRDDLIGNHSKQH